MLQRLLHPENYRGSFIISKHGTKCYILVRQLLELAAPIKPAGLTIGGECRLKLECEFPLSRAKESYRDRRGLKQNSLLSRS